MKYIPAFLLVLLPVSALAQQPQSMNDVDVQKMMQQAQELQACMQKVDQTELQKFQQRAMEVNDDIKALCEAGKRSEAQKMAMDFGKESEKNAAVQEMKKCGELAKGMIPQNMPQANEEIDYSKEHVCDHLGN